MARALTSGGVREGVARALLAVEEDHKCAKGAGRPDVALCHYNAAVQILSQALEGSFSFLKKLCDLDLCSACVCPESGLFMYLFEHVCICRGQLG